MQAQLREVDVNLIGVGAGLSYDVSGPTHHCLEDITIMKVLPNIEVFSPSDWVLAQGFIDYSIKVKMPKYIRLDGKALPQIYNSIKDFKIENGFSELRKGKKICLVSTGIMTHKAIEVTKRLGKDGMDIGIIDVFLIKPINEALFKRALKGYQAVITLEEGFIHNGGLDSMVLQLINRENLSIKFKNMGFSQRYVFDIGSRDYLHKLNHLDEGSIIKNIKLLLGKGKL